MNEIEQIKQQIQSLEERLVKLEQPEENSNQWKPEYEERYLYISEKGETYYSKWLWDSTDVGRLSIGNVFRTEEEAELQMGKLKVIAQLKKYAREFVVDDYNYEFYFNYEEQKIVYDYNRTHKGSTLYFPSIETAKQAVQAVGEERVRKYYLEVK